MESALCSCLYVPKGAIATQGYELTTVGTYIIEWVRGGETVDMVFSEKNPNGFLLWNLNDLNPLE